MTGEPSSLTEGDLHAYADGQLPAERRAGVERWLVEHADDEHRVREWQMQNEALRQLLAPVQAEPVPMRLSLVRIGARVGALAPAVRIALPAFVAGLVAGVSIAGLAWWHFRVPGVARPELAAHQTLATRAMAAHRTFAPEMRHPVEVRAGEEHLIRWLNRRTTLPVKAPDLSAEGFELLGGRLLPDGADGQAALLMFENKNGERLTLYFSKARTATETAFRYQEGERTGAFYWIDRDVAYVLTGPADRERMFRLAKRVYDGLDLTGTRG